MPIFVGVMVRWCQMRECGRRKCEFSLSIAISVIWSSPLVLHIEIYTASRGFLAIARLLSIVFCGDIGLRNQETFSIVGQLLETMTISRWRNMVLVRNGLMWSSKVLWLCFHSLRVDMQVCNIIVSLSPVLDYGTVCRQTLSRVTLCRGSGENLNISLQTIISLHFDLVFSLVVLYLRPR